MTIFEDIEKRLEALLESFFDRHFPSPLQPAEIAKTMAKEMERRKRVSLSLVYAPNFYEATLSPEDLNNLKPLVPSLEKELGDYIQALVTKRGYHLSAPLSFGWSADETLQQGTFRVDAVFSQAKGAGPSPSATVVIPPEEAIDLGLAGDAEYLSLVDLGSGQSYPLTKEAVVLGRDRRCDIRLADPSVSRRHARLTKREGQLFLEDLHSTNGTMLNDEEIKEATAVAGDRITLGTVTLVIRRAT